VSELNVDGLSEQEREEVQKAMRLLDPYLLISSVEWMEEKQ